MLLIEAAATATTITNKLMCLHMLLDECAHLDQLQLPERCLKQVQFGAATHTTRGQSGCCWTHANLQFVRRLSGIFCCSKMLLWSADEAKLCSAGDQLGRSHLAAAAVETLEEVEAALGALNNRVIIFRLMFPELPSVLLCDY